MHGMATPHFSARMPGKVSGGLLRGILYTLRNAVAVCLALVFVFTARNSDAAGKLSGEADEKAADYSKEALSSSVWFPGLFSSTTEGIRLLRRREYAFNRKPAFKNSTRWNTNTVAY